MKKIRVYELAKELNIENRDLIKLLNENGFIVKSHSSQLDDTIASFIRDSRNKSKSLEVKEYEEKLIKPGVIKRVPSNRTNIKTKFLEVDEYENIIKRCNEKVGFNAKDELAYIERGDALLSTHKIKDAISDYRRAIEINPDSIKAHYGMASAHIMAGSRNHAMPELEKAMELEKKLKIRHNLYKECDNV